MNYSASFRPMARTIVMLGADLIADEVTAVLELVKNAYDADAQEVRVRVNTDRDEIIIRDTGDGMSADDIINKWLSPGTSSKAAVVTGKPLTGSGRVTLGEKGIGRFAVHHLGGYLTLISRQPGSDTESVLKIDWSEYEDPTKYLDEIRHEVITRPAETTKKEPGTFLRIRGLKADWSVSTITRLGYVLALLMDFDDVQRSGKPFRVRLFQNDKEINLADPVRELLRSADHRVEGWISEDGFFHGAYNGHSIPPINLLSNCDLTYDHFSRWPCGQIKVKFFVVERSNRKSPLYLALSGTRSSPAYYQGMLVYRDGFRVLPYGNAGVDWLGLDSRRIKKVGKHISNSQLLGFVNISYNRNPGLKDKTNREGMQENGEFKTFQQLLLGVVNWLEGERERISLEKERVKAVKPVLEQIKHVLKAVPPVVATEVRALRDAYTQEVKRSDQRLASMLELAGIGLAAERMTHELGFLLRGIRSTLRSMSDAGCSELASELGKYVTQLEQEIKFLQPLYQAGRRRKEEVSVYEVIEHAAYLFGRDLEKHGIIADITSDSSDLVYKGNRGLLLQVLINLFDNAVIWLQKVPREHRRLRIRVSPLSRSILVADSGPGVPSENDDAVFEPFFSTRGGRGLGLYIVRHTLEEAGHSITLSRSSEEAILPGAVFKLTIAGTEE